MPQKITIIAILIVFGGIGWGVWATSNPHTWINGLVGYWSFDGQYTTSTNGTRDISNNNNWGAFNGGVKPVGGIVGQALSFDGVNDYVNAGDPINGSLDFGTGSATWEAWIKTTQSGAWKGIVEKRSNGIMVHNGSAGIQLYDGTNNPYIVNTAVNDGNWHHIVGVRDGSQTKLFIYVDGVKTGEVVDTAGNIDNAVSLQIGADTGGYFFNGLIDEVRVYNRALSADEVKQHYDQTRRNIVINNPSGTPPVGWWKMDEPTGATVRDYSVNADNGTVSNGGYGATSTDGKIGKALSFDGVDDKISFPASQLFASQKMTISTWINADNFVQWKGLIYLREDNTSNYLIIRNDGSALQLLIEDDNVTKVNMATPALPTSTWIHIVFTQDGTGWRFYLNGKQETFTGTNSAYCSDHLTINNIDMGYSGWAENYYDGLIDDVRIYNYARTADQIASDYRAGAYRTTIGTSVPSNWWTDGLVGYWNFDGQNTTSTNGTRDTSGSNNWGTFSGGVKPIAGIVGQALSFDGVDDYVTCGNNTILDLNGKTGRTFEAWVNLSSFAGETIFQRGGQGTAGYYWLMIYSQKGYFQFRNSTTTYTAAQTTNVLPITLNTWFHFVAAVDLVNDTISWYVNGNFIQQQNLTNIRKDTLSVNLCVGNYCGSTWWLGGLIDEVRIYNRALTAEEVMQHYQQTRRNLTL